MFLSWPFNFFIYVNTNLYQKYQKMTRNMKKISVASKIGILPILQEFPSGSCQILMNISVCIIICEEKVKVEMHTKLR